jgi:transcriptional regulator with XRE-family HTH domain
VIVVAELVQAYFDRQFGNFIREKRYKNRMSIVTLSKKCEVSFSTISKMERGEVHAKEELVIKLAEILNIDKDIALKKAGYVTKDMLKISVEGEEVPENTTVEVELGHTIYDIDLEWKDFIDEMKERGLKPNDVKVRVDGMEEVARLLAEFRSEK